jgi:hypothetical protein
MPVKTIHSRPDLTLGEIGPLLVMVPKSSPDNEAFVFIQDQVEAFAARFDKFAYMLILTSFDGPPKADADTQKKQAERMGKLREKLSFTAVVITVPGLKGTMMRMIVTALTFLPGYNFGLTKIFSKVSEATEWMKTQPGLSAELTTDPFLTQSLEDFVQKK